MSFSNPTPEAYLTAAEVREKIVSCIGGNGVTQFRKWTEGASPVLRRYKFKSNSRPYYRLSEVNEALTPVPVTV